MKRIVIYALLMAAALAVPTKRTDLGKLKPVEVVVISIEEEKVVLETDTGDWGRGESVKDALEDMKNTTSGLIYLDTADYLLVRKGAEEWIPQMESYLKGSVRICYVQPAVKIDQVASYLSVHRPELTLKKWTNGVQMQTLCPREEHMMLR